MSEPARDPGALAAHEFEAHRRLLWGLGYRMTGSAADADDIVQETFVRALERPPESRADGWRSWLIRVAANLAIDALRRRRRHGYTGPWLPAPIETGDEASAPGYEIASGDVTTEHRYDLMESVSMAFLLALERLTPRQRAVLILRDVFDYSVQEVASALGLSVSNVKVTHHRARLAMQDYDASRAPGTPASRRQRAAAKLQEFLTHLQNQDVRAVERMLADDARFLADGGGEFYSATQPVVGRHRVARLLLGLAAKAPDTRAEFRILNGEPALLAEQRPKPGFAPRYILRLDLDAQGRIREVHTILATDKLKAIAFTRPANPPHG